MRADGGARLYRARMSVADAPLPLSVAPPVATAPEPGQPPVQSNVPAGNRPPAPRPDGLDRGTGRLIAATFGIAWILCPALEPMPTGHVPDYPMWQLPLDLAAVASILAAVIVLWRGGRLGARLGAAAGVLMAVQTIVCPIAGHSPVGWWTWAQTGLSLFVLGTSAALMARAGRQTAEAPPA